MVKTTRAAQRILNSNHQALSVEDVAELAVALTADGCAAEYERALAEILRDSLALAGGPYIENGPSLAKVVDVITGRLSRP